MLYEDWRLHPKWVMILPQIYCCILHAKHTLVILTCNILPDNASWHHCTKSPKFLMLDKCYLGKVLANNPLRQSGQRSSSKKQSPVLPPLPAPSKGSMASGEWRVPAELRLPWALLQPPLLRTIVSASPGACRLPKSKAYLIAEADAVTRTWHWLRTTSGGCENTSRSTPLFVTFTCTGYESTLIIKRHKSLRCALAPLSIHAAHLQPIHATTICSCWLVTAICCEVQTAHSGSRIFRCPIAHEVHTPMHPEGLH